MNYIDPPDIPAGMTVEEYRRARPRHEHHPFLRAIVALIRNR